MCENTIKSTEKGLYIFRAIFQKICIYVYGVYVVGVVMEDEWL